MSDEAVDVKPIVVGARSLGLDNDPQFWQEVNTSPYLQAAVTALGQHLERVPEVEVTADVRSLMHVEAAERPPAARRSAAKNVSSPHLQNAFIDEARHSMGQPSLEDCHRLLDAFVEIDFNDDKPSVRGVVTLVTQPSVGPAYVMLDNDTKLMYPLNSIQAIRRMP
jgi:hypothetical protein